MDTSPFPKETLEAAKFSIHDTLPQNPSFAFVGQHFANSQLAYTLIYNLNTFLYVNPQYSIYLYDLHHKRPIIVPQTSLFNASTLVDHIGQLVVLDPWSRIAANAALIKQVYYYVYDPVVFNYISPQDITILKNNTLFFTRTSDYRKLLKDKWAIETSEILVPDCEIDLIIKILGI